MSIFNGRSNSDWNAIHTVLTIVAKIIETIEKRQFAALAPRMIYADTEDEYYLDGSRGTVTIPLYSIEDGELKAEQIPLPAYVEPQIAPPTSLNEVSLRKLMKMKSFRKSVFRLFLATFFLLFIAWIGMKAMQYHGDYERMIRDVQRYEISHTGYVPSPL